MKKKIFKNNGFTLIELLATIIIMISILSLSIISYNAISNAKKEDAFTNVKNEVESAAKEYFYANEYIFEDIKNGEDGSYKTILLKDLVDGGYMTSVTDPRTGKKLDKCTKVKIEKDTNGKFIFVLDDVSGGSCEVSKAVVVNVVTPSESTQPSTVNIIFHRNDSINNPVKKINNTENNSITIQLEKDEKLSNKNFPIVELDNDYYRFYEWNTSSDGTGDSFDSNTVVSENIDVYAIVYKYKFTVTFHRGEHVLTLSLQDVDYTPRTCTISERGEYCRVSLPGVKTEDDYNFKGWFTINNERFDTNTHVYNDVDVYTKVEAKQPEEISYKAYFYKNDGLGNLVSKIGSGSKDIIEETCTTVVGSSCTVTAPTITAGSNYAVRGWNLNSNGSDLNWYNQNQEIEVFKDTKYYAITYKNKFTTYFNINNTNKVSSIGSTSITCTIQNYDDNCSGYTTPSITAKSGYTVVGWSETKTGNKKYNPGQSIDIKQEDGKTFYAIARERSTITYGEVCIEPGNDSWCRGNITYTVTASDNYITDIGYKINGNYIEPNSDFSVSKSNSNRTLVLEYKSDTVGTNIEFYGVTNDGNTESITMLAKIDTTNPTIQYAFENDDNTSINTSDMNIDNYVSIRNGVKADTMPSITNWYNIEMNEKNKPLHANENGIFFNVKVTDLTSKIQRSSFKITYGKFDSTNPTTSDIGNSRTSSIENGYIRVGNSVSSEGKRYQTYHVCDQAGNCSDRTLYAKIDTEKPTISYDVSDDYLDYVSENNNYSSISWYNKEINDENKQKNNTDDGIFFNLLFEDETSGINTNSFGSNKILQLTYLKNGEDYTTTISNTSTNRIYNISEKQFERENNSISGQGNRYNTYQTCDIAGNCTEKSIYVRIDTEPPIIVIDQKTRVNSMDNQYTYHVELSKNYVIPSGMDAKKAYVKVYDDTSEIDKVYHDEILTTNELQTSSDYVGVANESNPVTIIAIDKAGNENYNVINKGSYQTCVYIKTIEKNEDTGCQDGTGKIKEYEVIYDSDEYKKYGDQATVCSINIVVDKPYTCETPVIDNDSPILTVNIYKRKKGGGKESNTPFYHKTFEGTNNGTILLNQEKWLNKANYPYGVHFEYFANEDISSAKWYFNQNTGLTKTDANSNTYKWKDESIGYGGFSTGTTNQAQDVTPPKKAANTIISHGIEADGYRYVKIIVEDLHGNKTVATFAVPMDKVGPSIQNITSPYATTSYCNKNNAMYTSFKVSDSLSGVNFVNHYLYNVKTDADYDEILNSASFISVKDGEVNNDTNGSQYMNFFNPSTTVSNGVFTIKRAWMYGSLTTARKNGCGTRGSLNVGSGAYCNYVASSDKAGNRAVARYGSCKPKE